MVAPAIDIPRSALQKFCQRHHIRRLLLFGSVLREHFGPESDIDVLVEFDPRHVPGFIGFAGLELELSGLFGGRKVDLNTPESFRPELRKQILKDAVVQYEQDGRADAPETTRSNGEIAFDSSRCRIADR